MNDKTEVIWLGTRYQLCEVTAQTLTWPNATVPYGFQLLSMTWAFLSTHYGQPHLCPESVVLFPHEVNQTFLDVGGDADTHSGFCQ